MIVNSFVTPSTQKEFSAVSEPGMLAKFWAQQWIPGWILSNFHLNNISVAQKLAELEPGERCWCNTWTEPDLCGRTYMLICWGGIIIFSWKQARNKWKTIKIVGFDCKKILQWSPLWIVFKGKNKNGSSLARTISASRGSFFANLITFERRSGLKNLCLRKIAILKMGWLCSLFKVIGPEEIPFLVWGRRKRPPTKMGST